MSFLKLMERMADIHNLNQAGAVLDWDQRTYMPAKGSVARSKQLATLAKISHEMFVAEETADLLFEAENGGKHFAADSDERAMLRVVRRSFDKAAKVPTELVVALAETTSRGQDVWAEARGKDDFASFKPWLEKIIELKRRYAAAVMPGAAMYDALLDDFEEGMTTRVLDPIFAELKGHGVPLVKAIGERGKKISDEMLTRNYDPAAQEKFCHYILKECGFSFERGRLDTSVHPFCTNFSQNDVRITTRWETDWLPGSLFGCLHEMGHSFYELGIDPKYEATPLAGGVSLGVHESQSRLWENLVGRSREFWEKYFGELQRAFPAQLGGERMEGFYEAINRVTPSLIRVEADEVTYNLHIILRYEMEQGLLSGAISVADAPGVWNEKMKASFGIEPPTDREGILQDVHWSAGLFGYFPTYSLGNILSAQLFAVALRDLPNVREEIRRGHFAGLLEWLRVHVHQYGRKYVPADLVKKATGKALSTEAYAKYLTEKFTGIYGL